MEQFMENFVAANGEPGKIIIRHKLFDSQSYDCNELQIINDDERIGVIIKKQEIFMYKQSMSKAICEGKMLTFTDERLTITIILR